MIRDVPRFLLPSLLALMTIGCQDASADCFAPGTDLPTRQATLTDYRLGRSARDLVEALFDRDLTRATALLRADPALARTPIGAHHDMLSVALATCEMPAVDLLLRAGAPPDGRERAGLPLRLALRAKDPDLAHRLLSGGASPNPAGSPSGPLRTAITLNSLGAVRMLLDFKADPDVMERTGNRPLHTALDMEHFRIAELLLDHRADPWAIDSGGANLGSAATSPMLTHDPEEATAQARLVQRLSKLGWPSPPPTPRDVRHLARDGKWPPAASGAPAVPAPVLAIIRQNP